MPSKYLEPSSKGFRQPLDKSQMNGQVYNTPRTAPLGGLDQIKEPYGIFKNDFKIKRPSSSK